MKNKYLISLLLLFISGIKVQAQGAYWSWAKSGSGSSTDQAYSVTADKTGNTIVVGIFFSTTIDLGLGGLHNSGGSDMFIVKYDAGGNALWSVAAGGINNDYMYSVTTDDSDNIYVTGFFTSPSITFDTITLNNDSSGTADLFIAKYNAGGNVIWARSAGGKKYESGYTIKTDPSGDVLVTGYFGSTTIIFGNDTLQNDTTSGVIDLFVVKYDRNGNELWARAAGGTGSDVGFSLAADDSGNVIISGYFSSTSIEFGTGPLINTGTFDAFIAKYNSNGNIQWAKSARGSGFENGYSVSSNGVNDIFLAGYFYSDTIIFGADTLFNDTIGTGDMFIVKYDGAGNVIWAKSEGSNNSDLAYSCSADISGNVLVSGFFNSSSITFGTTTLINAAADTSDIFVVKYDGNGNVLWAKSAGGHGSDQAYHVTTNSAGDVLIAGWFMSSTISFGPTLLMNADSTGLSSDIFVSKLSSDAGIQQPFVNNNFLTVYPNPATESFSVRLNSKLNDAELIIYDLPGREVFRKTLSGNKMEIEKGILKSGIYFVSVGNSERKYLKKIIVE